MRFINYYYEPGLFFFRFGGSGYGLLFKNFNKHKPLFSDRNKLHKNTLYIKNYKIELLTPIK